MKIPAVVSKVVASPGVRKALIGLVLAVAAAAGVSFSTGCHALTPAQEAKALRFECESRALAPLVGPVLDSEALLRDLYAGKAELGAVISNTGATEAEVKAALSALRACRLPAPVAEPDAGVVQ